MSITLSNSPPLLVGQQSAFTNDDEPRLQYSYPAPQQPPQPYQSYRDPSPSYSNHPTTLPPINVTANHPRDERWQQNPYGGTSATSRVPDTVFSPVASYPGQSFSYPTQNPPQVMLPDPRYSVPINPPPSSSTAATRRGPVSVERTATRSSAHTASTSPYSRHPPASNISSDHPPPKKKRKRADAEQLRVLNEVYARTAFPSTEERQELAARLNMTPRSVQIWYVSCFFFTSSTAHLISPLGTKINGSQCVTHTVSQPQFEEPDRITRLAPITVHHLGPHTSPRPYQLCPCRRITVDHLGPHPSNRTCQPSPCRRIGQAASARTLNRPPTSHHLPPTPLTSRYRAHRSLSKEPPGSIGPRVGIGRTTMTIMTVAVQSVVGYDALSRRSILLVPCKNHSFPLSKFSFFPTFTPGYSAALHFFSAYLLLFLP